MRAWRGGLLALVLSVAACSAAGGEDARSRDSGGASGRGRPGAAGDGASAGNGRAGTASTPPGSAGSAATPAGDPSAPARVLARGEPLGEALSCAFIAGYHTDEELYLRGAAGGVVQVSTWDAPPSRKKDCPVGWSTAGNGQGGGRFTRLRFTGDGSALVFGERLDCPYMADGRSRVLHHDLASGVTSVLRELDSPSPIIVGGAQLTLAIVRSDEDTYPPEPASPDDVQLLEVVAGGLRPIAIAAGDHWHGVPLGTHALIASWQGRTLLLVDRLAPLERRGAQARFEPSSLFDGLGTATTISWLRESSSGTRLCAIVDDDFLSSGLDGRGWVLTADGRWLPTPVTKSPPYRCEFSPDERRVMFGTRVYDVSDDALVEVASDADLGALPAGSAPWGADLFGRDESGLTRIAWSTLARETMLPAGALPDLCARSGLDAARPSVELRLPPDNRPLAIAKVSCGCIDCDISGSFAWHAESGRVQTVEEVWGEHDVYGVAWLPDGGAAVASTQAKSTGNAGEQELRPAHASYLHVRADGTVETIGPLKGVKGAIHSLASFPGSPSSAASP